MKIFEDVTLTWKGQDHTIESTRVMGAIAKIEEVITLKELGEYANKGDAPMAKLAMAFGSVLRYAGAKVSDDEVYAGMFSGESGASVMQSLSSLLTMMIPPNAFQNKKQGNDQAAPTGGKN
jgi:hypothetical protein